MASTKSFCRRVTVGTPSSWLDLLFQWTTRGGGYFWTGNTRIFSELSVSVSNQIGRDVHLIQSQWLFWQNKIVWNDHDKTCRLEAVCGSGCACGGVESVSLVELELLRHALELFDPFFVCCTWCELCPLVLIDIRIHVIPLLNEMHFSPNSTLSHLSAAAFAKFMPWWAYLPFQTAVSFRSQKENCVLLICIGAFRLVNCFADLSTVFVFVPFTRSFPDSVCVGLLLPAMFFC
jgi:hypothetical protein